MSVPNPISPGASSKFADAVRRRREADSAAQTAVARPVAEQPQKPVQPPAPSAAPTPNPAPAQRVQLLAPLNQPSPPAQNTGVSRFRPKGTPSPPQSAPHPVSLEPAARPSFAPRPSRLQQAKAPAGRRSDAPLHLVEGDVIRVLFGQERGKKAMLLVRRDDGEMVKVSGPVSFVPAVGSRITAEATRVEHPKYGLQFHAAVIIEDLPRKTAQATDYLARVLRGVDSRLATRMVALMGMDVFAALDRSDPALMKVEGVNASNFNDITLSWAEETAARALWSYMTKLGVEPTVVARVIGRFGVMSYEMAREKPYTLTEVEGFDFPTADKLAQDGGRPIDHAARAQAAVRHVLQLAAGDGHTAVDLDIAVDEAASLLEGGADAPQRATVDSVRAAIEARAGDKAQFVRRQIDGRDTISLPAFVEHERSIAQAITTLFNAAEPALDLAKTARERAAPLKDAEQQAAVSNVFESGVSVITGRPGGGKTTVVKVIADVAKDAGLQVVMAAPTGKAARRMEEATGFTAGTVHSLLKPSSESGGRGDFAHDAENPLEGDLFVIDEASMLDTPVLRHFLDAIPAGARVVLVGDVDQLASVGAGAVLRDIIESRRVPVTKLLTPHRTALDSDIVVNAHKIVNGNADGVDLRGSKDFRFCPSVGDQAILTAIRDQYLALMGKHGADGVQVLASMWGTPVGVDAINAMLKPIVNPPADGKPEFDVGDQNFRLGDRVMRMSNSKTLGVSNGEVGVIAAVDPSAKVIQVNFGDRMVKHEKSELLHLRPALATTIHKSQGSEYAGVITVIAELHRSMLNRNLIYTAVTRGKKDVVIVGESGAVRAAIRKEGASRLTGLRLEMTAGAPDLAASAAPRIATARVESDPPARHISPTRFAGKTPAPQSTPNPTPPSPLPLGMSAQRSSLLRRPKV